MWTKRFWKDTAERVLATAAVTALASWPVAAGAQLDWRAVAVTAGLAAAGTLLKCIVASQVGDRSSASLVQ